MSKPNARAQRPRRRLRAAIRARVATEEAIGEQLPEPECDHGFGRAHGARVVGVRGAGPPRADKGDGSGARRDRQQGAASRLASEALAREQDPVVMPLQWLVPRASAPGRGGGSPKRVEKFNAYKLSPLMESRYRRVPKSVEMKKKHVVLRSIPPLEGGPTFDHVTFTSTTANAEQASRLRASQSTPTLLPPSPIAGAGRAERMHLGKHDGMLRGGSSPPVGTAAGERPTSARRPSDDGNPPRTLRATHSQPAL